MPDEPNVTNDLADSIAYNSATDESQSAQNEKDVDGVIEEYGVGSDAEGEADRGAAKLSAEQILTDPRFCDAKWRREHPVEAKKMQANYAKAVEESQSPRDRLTPLQRAMVDSLDNSKRARQERQEQARDLVRELVDQGFNNDAVPDDVTDIEILGLHAQKLAATFNFHGLDDLLQQGMTHLPVTSGKYSEIQSLRERYLTATSPNDKADLGIKLSAAITWELLRHRYGIIRGAKQAKKHN